MSIKTIPYAAKHLEPYCVVEYEQHGNPILSVVLEKKKEKWSLLNQFGAELELPENRLYLLPEKIKEEKISKAELEKFLNLTKDSVEKSLQELNLEDAWNIFNEVQEEVSIVEIVELLASNNSLINHLAVRRLLIGDKVYFKRLKDTFQPRSALMVQDLKHQVKIEESRKKLQEELVQALVERIKGVDLILPESICLLEDYAALGRSLHNYKEAEAVVDLVIDQAKLKINKNSPEKAFHLLVLAKHFSENQNLSLIRSGRKKRFKAGLNTEVQKIMELEISNPNGLRDLSDIFSLTIDNEETKDFDDAISLIADAEGYQLGIHISDVASYIKSGSKLQEEAFFRGSSIYFPDDTIPMLPPELSENKFSLLQGEKRLVCSHLLKLDQKFNIIHREIFSSEIIVKRRLTYHQVDQILAEQKTDDQLNSLLNSLNEISLKFEARRLASGAVQLPRLEKQTKIDSSGMVSLHSNNEETAAHRIVSEMMIVANETAALFGKEQQLPLICRAQEKPDVDINQHVSHLAAGPAQEYAKRGCLKRSRIVTKADVHAGLGLEAYLQITSPIRRYMDLVNQQQILGFIQEKKIKYSDQQLLQIIKDLEGNLDEVSLLQRERNKYYLLRYLQQEKIKHLKGVIVKVDGPKPLVFIELLGTLNPFYPENLKDKDALKKKLGVEINLNVELLDPRNEKLILREVI